jgi:hypothetical protein
VWLERFARSRASDLPIVEQPLPPVEDSARDSWSAEQRTSNASRRRSFWPAVEPNSDIATAWDRITYLALLALIVLWAALFRKTWATWGSVTIDSGREMYVPVALSQGEVLYRDIAYPYLPLAPYFNALLFRLLGVHLEVLYWAGSVSALGSAILLFLTGMKLSFRLAGWAAGAVLLFEAFRCSLFSFPLPYSFASVYGCLVACLFCWILVNVTTSPHPVWQFAAGTTAGLALLLKLEFGAACYAVLALLIVVECLREQSWKKVLQWLVAILPGAVACCAVIAWMVSIRGVNFITHENMDSWPSSYFMRTYGKLWLKGTGFDLSLHAFGIAAVQLLALGCVIAALRWIFRRMEGSEQRLILWIALGLAGLVFVLQYPSLSFFRIFGAFVSLRGLLDVLAFPPAMGVLVIGAAAGAWWFWARSQSSRVNPAFTLLLTFAGILPFRSLLETKSYGLPIYYDGPEILCMLILASMLIAPFDSTKRLRLCATILISIMCLFSVVLNSNIFDPYFKTFVPFVTDRGTIRLPEGLAANYKATVAFMKQRAALGESVMSVPEDTSLYFFSGTDCPARVLVFVPGVVAPGEMTNEVIAQLDKTRPRFLIWSNRKYPEYGVPRFGTDFDVPIGDYFRANYHPIGTLVPFNPMDWSAVVWERITPARPDQHR